MTKLSLSEVVNDVTVRYSNPNPNRHRTTHTASPPYPLNATVCLVCQATGMPEPPLKRELHPLLTARLEREEAVEREKMTGFMTFPDDGIDAFSSRARKFETLTA